LGSLGFAGRVSPGGGKPESNFFECQKTGFGQDISQGGKCLTLTGLKSIFPLWWGLQGVPIIGGGEKSEGREGAIKSPWESSLFGKNRGQFPTEKHKDTGPLNPVTLVERTTGERSGKNKLEH